MLRRLRCHPLPGFIARMQPSDASFPSASALVPLASGLPRCERLFLATSRLRPQTRAVYGGLVTGAPLICRVVSRRNETLPRSLGRPLHARRTQSPRRVSSPVALAEGPTVAFRSVHALGTREIHYFRGCLDAAHVFAYLRIAVPRRRRASQGSLPSSWAAAFSGGFRTRWTTNRISEAIASLPPSGPDLPGRFEHRTV